MYTVKSKYGTYNVSTKSESEARYIYTDIISKAKKLEWSVVYNSIESTEMSGFMSTTGPQVPYVKLNIL